MTMCEPTETRWWRTALLLPGMLVKKKGVGELFMVAGRFPDRAAALLWPLKKLTNKILVPESITHKSQLTWACVLNVLDWQAVEHEIMSPLHLFLTGKALRSRADLQGQVLIKQNGVAPLLTYLANKGFAGLPLRLVKRIRKAPCFIIPKIILEHWGPAVLSFGFSVPLTKFGVGV